MSLRNTITETETQVVKRFTHRDHYLLEVSAYRDFAWAAPRLLLQNDVDLSIVVERLPTAEQLTWWKPAESLRKLLQRLHDFGVNHRDVHVGNIVCDPVRGPLLIDWELHTRNVGKVSYDLHGPKKSGVQQPAGQRGAPMWWGAKHERAVGLRWEQ